MSRLAKTKYEVKCRLKKGDEVVVISGKNKGESGTIETVSRKSGKVFITGLNIAKRHSRPTMSNQDGGIIDKVMPLDISNVALLDPKHKKPTRIGYKMQDGRKVRFAKKSGTIL